MSESIGRDRRSDGKKVICSGLSWEIACECASLLIILFCSMAQVAALEATYVFFCRCVSD